MNNSVDTSEYYGKLCISFGGNPINIAFGHFDFVCASDEIKQTAENDNANNREK